MSKARVLVVDDHPSNLKLLSFVLDLQGYAVLTATSAREARAVIERDQPALVLMDVQMPEVDGLKLTRELRGDPRWARLPIVAVTAYAMASDEQSALEAGCDGFISKPIDTRALVALVREVLARSSA